MKMYELSMQQNPGFLLQNFNVVVGCADLASRFKELGQLDLANSYIAIAECFTNALMDEATIQPTSGVAAFLGLKPLSSMALAQKMNATTKEGRAAIKKELRKLIKDGVVVQEGRSYALAGKPTSPAPVEQ